MGNDTSRYLHLAEQNKINVPPEYRDHYGHLHGKELLKTIGTDYHGENRPEEEKIGLLFLKIFVEEIKRAHKEVLRRAL